jgi:hypothetical protein
MDYDNIELVDVECDHCGELLGCCTEEEWDAIAGETVLCDSCREQLS